VNIMELTAIRENVSKVSMMSKVVEKALNKGKRGGIETMSKS
jgi:hypothetical protein